ncbi:MAG TPA: carbohydrate ABC transporter permease, partial [Dongiaceae bacterium]|nr:carbohydrate ABC transporter permease [Dongiaceae bacterium]
MTRRRQRLIKSWLIYAAALLLTVVILAPVIWMGLMSVSSTNDLTAVPLRWIPAEWDFSRYIKLLTLT